MTFSTLASPGVSLQGGGGSGSGTASLPISGNGATVTASTPLINGTQTWNNGAVTFTSLLFNVTDTASAAGSLLMDLQVGGASKVKVGKNGGLALGGGSLNTNEFNTPTSGGLRFGSGIHGLFPLGSTELHVIANGTTTIISSAATTRINAGKFVLGAADAAAPVAQTLSVQSVVTGTTNTAGANLTITGSQGTGTGEGGSIIFQVAPAGSTGTAQNALQNALLIDGDGQATFTIKNTSGTPSLQIAKSGSSSIQITTSATFSVGSSASSLTLNANAGSSPIYAAGSYFNIGTAANNDVRLFRDAANTLALRNGNNGQTFRIYGRFTDITNDFERFFINAPTTSGDAVQLGTQKGATAGTARALELQTDATSRLTLDTVGSARIVTALTVATLPATPLTGMIARVTDALAPAVGVTVAAGGAAQALCWYNGANWTVIGV